METGFAYNKDRDAGLMTIDKYSRQDHLLEAKVTMTKSFSQLSNFKFGAETFHTGRLESLNGLSREYNDQVSSGFAETDLFLTDKIVARLGLRGEYSSYLQKYNLAPRTSLGLKTSAIHSYLLLMDAFIKIQKTSTLLSNRLDLSTLTIISLNMKSIHQTGTLELKDIIKIIIV
ncbi:hypothetical protein [Pedobacter sp. NJ-S-72]